MTRTILHRTLSGVAALALVSAFASGAVAGEAGHFPGLDHTLTNKQAQGHRFIYSHSYGLITQGFGTNPKTPTGFAVKARRGHSAPTTQAPLTDIESGFLNRNR